MLESRITIEGLEKLQRTPELIKRIIKEAGYGVESIMKKKVPVKSGRLKSSIATEIQNAGFTVIIAPHTKYAQAINYGLPPSPGRYVPAIGKRLIPSGRGMWPGFKGRRYIEKTKAQMEGVINKLTDAVIREWFEI
jgi:hypothetical protein